MKSKRDIEKLAQWALREELPKGRAVATSAGALVMRRKPRVGLLASLIGAPMLDHDDSLGFVPGEPHADAGIIGDAIAAEPDEARIETDEDARLILGEFAPIAGSDGVRSLRAAIFNPQALVLARAIAGTRPPWQFEISTPARQFLQTAGRPRAMVHGIDDAGDIVHLEPRRGSSVRRYGLYDLAMSPRSPLLWRDPAPLSVGHARAEYFFWHRSLTSLARILVGALATFEALPPDARPLPWITGQSMPPAVLPGRVLGADDAAIRVLIPKRRAPGRPMRPERASEVRKPAFSR